MSDILPDHINKVNDEILDKIKKFADEIYPFTDSVQIFVTKHESNEVGTSNLNYGLGNWFARYGQIVNWVNNNDVNETE